MTAADRSQLAPGDPVCLASYRHGINRLAATVEKVGKTRVTLTDGSVYRMSDGLPVGSGRPGAWDFPATLEPFTPERRGEWQRQQAERKLARTRRALTDAAATATQEQADACLAILAAETGQ